MISVLTPDGTKNIAAVSVLTPDGAKNIASALILTPDGSKTVWSAAGGGDFSLSADPNPCYGAVAQSGPATVTTQTCTVTPVGGTAPYTYAWVRIMGPTGFTVLSPTSGSTAFRCTNVNGVDEETANFQVTVTDARGRTATTNVYATASNYGKLDGGI